MQKFTRRDFMRTLGAGSAGVLLAGIPLKRRLLYANSVPFEEKDAKELKPKEEFDVAIVGSGPAGLVLASELARNGIKSVVLESGYSPYDSSTPNISKLDAYSSAGELSYPVAATRFRGLGGSSNLWGGICPRLLPRDFEINPYTPSDVTWPIKYNELEPYFLRAEKQLRVSGGESNIYSPPRSADFPFEPDSKRDISDLQEVTSEIGLVIEYTPLAWSFKYNAPLSVAESHVPELKNDANVTIVSGATVTKVLHESRNEVSGFEVQTLDKEKKVIRSRYYVLACGGIETPRLLMLSKSSYYPNGIGNDNDLVGRFFMDNPEVAQITGRVKGGPSSLFKRANKRAISHQFDAEFKAKGLGSVEILFDYWGVQFHEFRGKNPFTSLGGMLDAHRHPTLRYRAIIEMEPLADNRITLDHNKKDYFGNPGTKLTLKFTEKDNETILASQNLIRKIAKKLKLEDIEELNGVVDWGCHHAGTYRMGDDPKTSVVDKNLKLHSMDNFFLTGSGVFVTEGSSNPTLTISALSVRLADGLAKKLKNKEKQGSTETVES